MADDVKTRLAAARAAKEKKEAASRDEAEARELEVLELEAKLDTDVGVRGTDYEIVETIKGPIAVKLGEAILHSRFQAAKEINEASIHDYVYPCVVHPAKEKYLEIVGSRPAIAARCAVALASLYGVKAGNDAGKF